MHLNLTFNLTINITAHLNFAGTRKITFCANITFFRLIITYLLIYKISLHEDLLQIYKNF